MCVQNAFWLERVLTLSDQNVLMTLPTQAGGDRCIDGWLVAPCSRAVRLPTVDWTLLLRVQTLKAVGELERAWTRNCRSKLHMQRYPRRDARPLPGARPIPTQPESSSEEAVALPSSNATLDMMDDALARDLAPKKLSPSPPPEATMPVSSSPTSDFAARTTARTAARLDQVQACV